MSTGKELNGTGTGEVADGLENIRLKQAMFGKPCLTKEVEDDVCERFYCDECPHNIQLLFKQEIRRAKLETLEGIEKALHKHPKELHLSADRTDWEASFYRLQNDTQTIIAKAKEALCEK